METTDNHTPTPEELALCIEESAVRAADACEQSPAVLRVDGSVIGTLGNFSASIGKAKSKKTFNVAALTAAAVTNGTVLHYRASFPEGKRGILYIDTEQGRPHCQQVLRRILRLAGLPEERDPDNLVMLTLRKFPPDMRMAIVDHAIYNHQTEVGNRWHPRPALRHQLAQGGDRHHLPFHAMDRRPADPYPHHPAPEQE